MADWPSRQMQWARIRNTTNFSAPSGGGYAPFDTEEADTDNMVTLGTNNDRITIRTPAVYVASLAFRIDGAVGIAYIHGGASGTTRYAATNQGAQRIWGTLNTPPKQCAAGEFFRVFLDTASMVLDGDASVNFYSYVFAVHRVA